MVSRVLDKKTLGLNENMKKKKVNKKQLEQSLVTERQVTLQELTSLLNNDADLAMFFLEWLENGHNVTKAYLKFHPNVAYNSATILGSRMLTKVNIPSILEALGIGASKYLEQLEAGLNAGRIFVLTKWDKEGKKVQELDLSQPDHKVRRMYHEALGKMLGFEKDNTNQTLNYFDFSKLGDAIAKSRQERGLQQ